MFPVRLLLAAMLATALLGSLPAQAQDVIPPKVLIRRFPVGQFCALPVSISFVAPETPITVTFTAVQFITDASSGEPVWTDQAIDNVTIAPSALVAANTRGPLEGRPSEICYDRPFGDPAVSYFHFNGLSIDLLEQFDTNPTLRGWSLKDGAYIPDRSAPRDVENDDDDTFGCVGIGDGAGIPDTTETKSVSFTFSGLTEGDSYDLGAWWSANFVRFPYDRDYLTITITTDSSTPVAKKSWGALKRMYR